MESTDVIVESQAAPSVEPTNVAVAPQAAASVEMSFEEQPLPVWWKQITLRSVVVSAVLGALISFITMKISLATGIAPAMNMSASLLGFFIIKSWTRLLERCGIASQPFTRQENTVLQTCIVACSTLAFSGGFSSYLLAMSDTVAKSFGTEGSGEVHMPSTGKIIAFLFLVSFIGLFAIVPLRKTMIIDYKLIYPSGSATANLINSFHTPQGARIAKLQMLVLLKSFAASFLWSFFQWFYTAGNGCGFQSFPTFGLQAYKRRFYFDFSATYVGGGLISPRIISFSMLLGSIISGAIMWPFIESKQGEWYTDKSPSSLTGINGYKVPMAIFMVLGDGFFQLSTIVITTIHSFYFGQQQEDVISTNTSELSYDERHRRQIFLRGHIPNMVAFAGYILLATISIIFVPMIFKQLKYYHVAAIYICGPILAFCNSYGAGLTDWSLGSLYRKFAVFAFGAWVGESSGGTIAGLAACGVMMAIVVSAADLMQDFKTGHLTLTSPRSMFVSQIIGTTLGCVINPIVFLAFQAVVGTDNLGRAGSTYSAPLAMSYHGIALLSVQGVGKLPKHSLQLCLACFLVAVAINWLKMIAKQKNWRVQKYVPSPMAMAVPFFAGPYFSVDMCVGSLILFTWNCINEQSAKMFASIMASGLICGDGIWALPSSVLTVFNVKPPICMKFLSNADNVRVDQFLQGLAAPSP